MLRFHALTPLLVFSAVAGGSVQPDSTWQLTSRVPNVLEARIITPAHVTRPPFDSVVHASTSAGRTTRCSKFGRPDLFEAGSDRFWSYRMTSPKTGACAGVALTQLTALGYRGAVPQPSAVRTRP